MRIGITDTHSGDTYENYEAWLHTVDHDAELVKLSYALGNASALNGVDGLLLTGGGDVHPQFYNREDAVGRVKEADERRDAFEFALIDQALERDMPILGVCRGMQTMNVYLSGSLIVDLVASRFSPHTAGEEPIQHSIAVVPNTLLHALTGTVDADVNSFHHQAVDRLGRGLLASALSPDGVVEAAEWMMKDGMPFLLLVQWHPERMNNDSLSHKLALMFLREANRYKHTKNDVSLITERIN